MVVSRSKIYSNVSSGTEEHSGYSFTFKRSTVDASPGGARQDAARNIRFTDNVFEPGRRGRSGYWSPITDFDGERPAMSGGETSGWAAAPSVP